MQATAAQVRDARDFIADCGASDTRWLTAAGVVAVVQDNYVGGWAQFVADGE